MCCDASATSNNAFGDVLAKTNAIEGKEQERGSERKRVETYIQRQKAIRQPHLTCLIGLYAFQFLFPQL